MSNGEFRERMIEKIMQRRRCDREEAESILNRHLMLRYRIWLKLRYLQWRRAR